LEFLSGGSAVKKSHLAGIFAVVATLASGPVANAGTVIPYPNAGTINPETYTFTAAATGDIIGFLYSANAADLDSIAMSVNGGPLGTFGLVNTSPSGTSFNFGAVTAGDVITFVLKNATEGFNVSSNPGANADGNQHVYSVAYTNPGPFQLGTIPTGTFVAFEDRLAAPFNPSGFPPSDFDYNDDSFVFTNVASSSTPIPGALPLFASGLGALGLLARRRRRKNAAI
jgi:hypothetical protein